MPGGTGTALSAPDSRIEIVTTPRVPAAHRRSLSRWLLPLGLVVLAAGGGLWLRGRDDAQTPAESAELQVPSAPTTPDASFSLSLESDPPGASVSEGSVRLGTTPFSLTLSLPEGSSPRVFVLEKEGYQPYVVRQGAAQGQVHVVAVFRRSQRLRPCLL